MLLTSTGWNCFRIRVLKDLAFPDAPKMKTFAQLATLLREHFKPTCLNTAERYRFRSTVQQQGQPIADYVHTGIEETSRYVQVRERTVEC